MEKFECLICGRALENHSEEERQIHVNACLGSSSSCLILLLESASQFGVDLSPSDSNEDDGNDSWSGVSDPRDGQTDAQIDAITAKSLGKGRIPQLGNGTWKAGDPRQKGDLWYIHLASNITDPLVAENMLVVTRWSPVDCSVDRLPMNFSPGE